MRAYLGTYEMRHMSAYLGPKTVETCMYRPLETSSSPSAVKTSLIFTKVSGPMCLCVLLCLFLTVAVSEPFGLLFVSVSVWMHCVCQ
jgi:hypothetical protein